ncbi:MAG: DUF885 domain-containing protein [Acidobacteriota bacterium]
MLTSVMASFGHGETLYDQFFDQYYFPLNPTTATASGIHKYDGKLEDYSRAGMENRSAALQSWLIALNTMPEPQDAVGKADRQLVLSYLRASQLEVDTIRMWERDPDHYSSGITSSAFTIMSRTFASPEDRLASLIEREKAMPKVLQDARLNLKNPPKIYTEIAIAQMEGNISFFEHDVPLAFNKVSASKKRGAKLLDDFKQSNAAVMAALRDYGQWLKSDLLPRSNGDFRLGADNYAKKLLYEEMVDIPLDRLLEIGYADLRANQKKFAEVAGKIDAKKMPREILTQLELDHPKADGVLEAFRATLDGLRQFITEKKIVTIPSQVPPILEETPPFMRALTFASMDTPGPYERQAKEAYFNVTLAEKDWSAERVEDFLRGFHRGTILSTAIHEAYPGHYVQFQWMQQVPSKVRKLLGANSNAEGWAHYSEQMMLDEGYGGDDPKVRLGQLQDALLRDARYIIGIEMHTGKRSFDDAITFFEKEGYQTHETAVRETKRGTSDATYLYYTLGKLQIMKLREDYRKLKGPAFTLEEFHNRFMQQGFPPIKIVREALLGDSSPTL